jgi:hypothetical protein
VGALLAFGVDADLAIVSVLAYRAIAIWLPAPVGLAALGALRRTIAAWGHEDAATVVEVVEVVPPIPVAEVVRPFPCERRTGWRPLESPAHAAA